MKDTLKNNTVNNNINKEIIDIFRNEKKKNPNICPKDITLEMLAKAMGAETKKEQLNDVGIQVENKNKNGLWSAYYIVMGLEFLDIKLKDINKNVKFTSYDPKLDPFDFDKK